MCVKLNQAELLAKNLRKIQDPNIQDAMGKYFDPEGMDRSHGHEDVQFKCRIMFLDQLSEL
jgi:hypothetical protein